MSFKLQLVKNSLPLPLISASELKSSQGLRTGVDLLDRFFSWQGLPCGDVVLFSGSPGCGATRLWIKTAVEAQKQGRWVAWINGSQRLCPLGISARGLNLRKTLIVDGNLSCNSRWSPSQTQDLFWLLQEMISSRLFSLISCPLISLFRHQLQKIKQLARAYGVTLVFFADSISARNINSLFSLWSCVLLFQKDFLTVQKARNRLTPFVLSSQVLNEDFMCQITTGSRSLVC
ncbi:MAG: recA protein [Bdellovibrio sp.]